MDAEALGDDWGCPSGKAGKVVPGTGVYIETKGAAHGLLMEMVGKKGDRNRNKWELGK